MNLVKMTAGTERNAEVSPRFKARMAGVFYVLEGLTSVFGGELRQLLSV